MELSPDFLRWSLQCLYTEDLLPTVGTLLWFLKTVVLLKPSTQELADELEKLEGAHIEKKSYSKVEWLAWLNSHAATPEHLSAQGETALQELGQDVVASLEHMLAQGGWPHDCSKNALINLALWLQLQKKPHQATSLGKLLSVLKFWKHS